MNDWEEDVLNSAAKWEKDLLNSKKRGQSRPEDKKSVDDVTSKIGDAKPEARNYNNNEKSLKDSIDSGIKIAKAIHRSLTKNSIPKNHDDIISMKERLEYEEKQLVEKNKAIQVIKELQARNKQREYLAKLERRDKIRGLFAAMTLRRHKI